MTVLVVGFTRMLGSKIVAAVLYKGTVEVKAMVRSSNDSHKEKRQKIDEIQAKGAGVVSGDLMKPETLLRACAEVDVIVSAVGNNEVTLLGQKNLEVLDIMSDRSPIIHRGPFVRLSVRGKYYWLTGPYRNQGNRPDMI